MIYKHWILSALFLIAGKPAAQNLVIAKQGQFTVGGETLQREGTYDNSKFVGWATQEETGQSYRGDHAFVGSSCLPKAMPCRWSMCTVMVDLGSAGR